MGVEVVQNRHLTASLEFETAKPIVEVEIGGDIDRNHRCRPRSIPRFQSEQFLSLEIRISDKMKARRTKADIAVERCRCADRAPNGTPLELFRMRTPRQPNGRL